MTGQPTAPRTDCEHRTVEGLTNWTSDGEGDTKPDGVYWYCKSCGIEFTPKAAAASVPAPEQDEAVRHKNWCATFRYNLGLECNCKESGATAALTAGKRDSHQARETAPDTLATPPPVPAAPGLDVERLRDALMVIPREDVAEAYAEEVAAEYIRLSPDQEEAM